MATLETRLRDLATAIGTDIKALNTKTGALANLATTDKSNLVAAMNEVRQLALDAAAEGGATLNDAATNTTEGWTSQKITDFVAVQIAAVVGADVPAALNTLDELAAALGDDPNAIASITTALGNRLRFDAAQTLTAPQKVQGNANLGSLSLVQSGDPDADLVGVYNTAKA